MFAIGKLMASVTTLAQALADLAATVTTANAELRQRLALDQQADQLLMVEAPAVNGEPQPAGTGKRGRKAD